MKATTAPEKRGPAPGRGGGRSVAGGGLRAARAACVAWEEAARDVMVLRALRGDEFRWRVRTLRRD